MSHPLDPCHVAQLGMSIHGGPSRFGLLKPAELPTNEADFIVWRDELASRLDGLYWVIDLSDVWMNWDEYALGVLESLYDARVFVAGLSFVPIKVLPKRKG